MQKDECKRLNNEYCKNFNYLNIIIIHGPCELEMSNEVNKEGKKRYE